MNFEQYKEDVEKSMKKWLDTMQVGSRAATEELKESTGDLIAGWKESFPRRREEIQAFIDDTMYNFFKDRE